MYDNDQELSEKMKIVAQKLNLRGHQTGHWPERRQTIYGPGDIEGHRVSLETSHA